MTPNAERAQAAEKTAITEAAPAAAQSELDGVNEAIDAASDVEAGSLAAAANKRITDEMVAAVNTLLACDDPREIR